MDYLQNHIWCSDSIWGGHYDCRHLVSFSSYEKESKEDWDNLIDEDAERFFDQSYYDLHLRICEKQGVVGDDTLKDKESFFYRDVKNLKPHVLEWLHENVKDRKDPDCEKGWCIGSTEYRKGDSGSITVFFHRRNDAMAFVRKFSKWKKPTYYCQYFADVRKKLNLDTLKYEEV